MDTRFREAERLIDAAIAEGDVACMSPAGLRDQVRRLNRLGRKVTGYEAVTVGELARRGAWNDGTARNAADWVAAQTGAGWGEANARIALGEGLRERPETTDALLAGRISGTQAAIITRGASVDPHSEARLLELAERTSVKELQAASDRIRATESGALAEQQAAIHRTRYLRTWIDREGAFRIDAKLTKAAGAKVLAVLEPYMETEFADARRQGRREQPDAYRADALVTMAEVAMRGGRRRAKTGDETSGDAEEDQAVSVPSAQVTVIVDYYALLRGHVEGDETCEIEGVGPVPVSDVQRLMGDPLIRILRTKGKQVEAATTLTRVVREPLRRAVEHRDRVCVVPGCGIASGVEIDHLVPFAQGGPTSIENVQRLCKHHHRLKTAGKAQLTRWETQDGPQFGWLIRTADAEDPPPIIGNGVGAAGRVRSREPGGPDDPGASEELFPDTGTG